MTPIAAQKTEEIKPFSPDLAPARSAETKKPQTPRVGERLCEMKLISPDQLRIALHEQREKGGMLGEALVRLGFLDQATLTLVLAAKAGLPSVDLKKTFLDPSTLALLPQTIAKRCRAIPLHLDDGMLDIAMADPYDIVALDEIRRHLPRDTVLLPQVASPSDIEDTLAHAYDHAVSVENILRELETGEEIQSQEPFEHPMVRLVNAVLIEAVRRNASDIHMEPESGFIRVRYRIDGHLHQAHALHRSHWGALSHRLKIMAGMNIADTRSIQDGRFTLQVGGGQIDCRAAIMPSIQGETIVLRLLDHRRSLLALPDLGFSPKAMHALEIIMARPQGLTLITGPTGSGKTTTLYALLRQLNRVDVNIVSLEEPVEYQIDMIRQTAVQDAQGLDFAAGVRGVLRMDPDIVFIGEIRDAETAQMALRAAMTGHQVFSTLHANDAVGAVARLMDFGISPRLIADNLVGLVAQRLVRTFCPHCKTTRPATPEEVQILHARTEKTVLVGEAKGCDTCHHTGRLGRTAVAEILPLSPLLEDLIAEAAPRRALLDQARREGMESLQKNGLMRVMEGDVALDDLRRAVDLSRTDIP